MPLEALEILLLAAGLFGHWNSRKMSSCCRVLIMIPRGIIRPQSAGTITVSGSFLPLLDCKQYLGFPRPRGFPAEVFREITALFGNFACSREILSKWLHNFYPDHLHAQEVLEVFKYQIALGLQCWKLFTIVPKTLRSFLDEYTRIIRPAEAHKYRGVSNRCTEVFLFHHGLRMLDPRIRAPLKNKSIVDVGAFNGDSALVFSEYAKDVYSFELSSANFAVLKRVFANNPSLSANVHAYHMGVSDKEGVATFTGRGVGVRISNGPGELVPITTIDAFVQKHNLRVGFLKADVEGHAFAVVKGAIRTLSMDRPMFSFASYHDFSEMYNLSTFLMNLLPNYYFEWRMEDDIPWAFFSLSLFGRPKEKWET
jgi:FkbM family methyltransferase